MLNVLPSLLKKYGLADWTSSQAIVVALLPLITGGKWKLWNQIPAAGVSAVPMAARVAQVEGQKADPSNFLLMHAMGPNVSGVIGSAVAAGILLAFLG